jgi:hypothetical protein
MVESVLGQKMVDRGEQSLLEGRLKCQPNLDSSETKHVSAILAQLFTVQLAIGSQRSLLPHAQ